MWPSVIYNDGLVCCRYGLVREGHSALYTYVQEGDNRAARLHSQIVATRLNRLHATSDPTPVAKRRQIRTALLATLKGLPLRDEVCVNTPPHKTHTYFTQLGWLHILSVELSLASL